MLGHAARLVDIWNTMSFAEDFAAQIAETQQRVMEMDACCAAIGRDPASLRRSYYIGTSRQSDGARKIQYYESEKMFREMVNQVIAIGISDIVLLCPWVESQVQMLERIARNALPPLKAAHAA